MGTDLSGDAHCTRCGQPADRCVDGSTCGRPADPPRFCGQCGRRLREIVLFPGRTMASCPAHPSHPGVG